MSIHSLGVSIICLSETILDWKWNHLTKQFEYIIKKAWPKKLSLYAHQNRPCPLQQTLNQDALL